MVIERKRSKLKFKILGTFWNLNYAPRSCIIFYCAEILYAVKFAFDSVEFEQLYKPRCHWLTVSYDSRMIFSALLKRRIKSKMSRPEAKVFI